MYIKGKVSNVGQVTSGTSTKTGNQWKSQDIVVDFFETERDRWAQKVVLGVRNEKIDELKLKVGDTVEAGFELEAREYNGRWFQGTRLFSIRKVAAEPQQTTTHSEDVGNPQQVPQSGAIPGLGGQEPPF